ncbi:hypothetical protein FOXB_16644 [Fusarium oxysporum f. sp. conglutinans Fo5176]|uniref:Uncharacterized protein n=1 Tax=Fusarium oxysporum (strain Fo5176) TaxID=660025 RepID=F9GDB0_FUSOF|nr:hypothetical protein FOXB_16644 [Fusarium oxysporum f. sp. conglutinans Fo5176]
MCRAASPPGGTNVVDKRVSQTSEKAYLHSAF